MPASANSESTLLETLKAAPSGDLPMGWLFLEEGKAGGDTRCVLLVGPDVSGLATRATSLGFPVYGLDTRFLQIIFESSADRSYPDSPSDDELIEAYLAQLEFDADASRHFYTSLGAERAGVPCQNPGCTRGAIELSVLCRLHHFESVKHRPCPPED
jgi:hypothetical protein